jgi:hypothetical protein
VCFEDIIYKLEFRARVNYLVDNSCLNFLPVTSIKFYGSSVVRKAFIYSTYSHVQPVGSEKQNEQVLFVLCDFGNPLMIYVRAKQTLTFYNR